MTWLLLVSKRTCNKYLASNTVNRRSYNVIDATVARYSSYYYSFSATHLPSHRTMMTSSLIVSRGISSTSIACNIDDINDKKGNDVIHDGIENHAMQNQNHSSKNGTGTTATATATATTTTKRRQQHKQTQEKTFHHHHKLPKRIILVRHGESIGNLDENSYAKIPDWKIPLTRRGERQAQKAAEDLWKLITSSSGGNNNTNDDGDDDDDASPCSPYVQSLYTYCSPYTRALETWQIIEDILRQKSLKVKEKNSSPSSFKRQHGIHIIGTRQEPRLAEQQFGNFQNPRKVRTAKAERHTFGRFFFRFPNGEAGLDVYNRVSSFLATMSRDMEQFADEYEYNATSAMMQQQQGEGIEGDDDEQGQRDDTNGNGNENNNNGKKNGTAIIDIPPKTDMDHMTVLLVTHGLTLRLFLMRYFQFSVDEFEQSINPQNAKLIIMDRRVDERNGKEYYTLSDEAKDALNFKRRDDDDDATTTRTATTTKSQPVHWRGESLDWMPYDPDD